MELEPMHDPAGYGGDPELIVLLLNEQWLERLNERGNMERANDLCESANCGCHIRVTELTLCSYENCPTPDQPVEAKQMFGTGWIYDDDTEESGRQFRMHTACWGFYDAEWKRTHPNRVEAMIANAEDAYWQRIGAHVEGY